MNHLQLAHLIWKEHLKPGSNVIDATLGNGHDTLYLANLALTPTSGSLTGFDIQSSAIEATKRRLSNNLSPEILKRINLYQVSHAHFPPILAPVDLIVYNLGYLPGGDKTITTELDSSLKSLQSATSIIAPGGLISLTCYPGHPEGFKETAKLKEYIETSLYETYIVSEFKRVSLHNSPILILLHNKL